MSPEFVNTSVDTARLTARQGKSLRHQGFRTSVPELRVVVKGIQDCWGVALARSAFDTDRNRSAISECKAWIVACTASNGSIDRQASVEEQLLTQSNFLRTLRIISRYRGTCGLDWDSKLL